MQIPNILQQKSAKLFMVLGGFFVCNALIAELIGVKIFSLEKVFGSEPFSFSFFGKDGLGFNLTVGVLLWPIVFVMTDVINEYFGEKGVRFLSILTAILISYAFVMIMMGIWVPSADFWPNSMQSRGIENMDVAFNGVFGQGQWIIIGSIIAFLVGQIVDANVFYRIKKWTGQQRVWLRATVSTLISQFIDSYIVLLIAFYIGADWDLRLVLAIGTVNYIYKFVVAVLLIPAIYAAHAVIDRYLGKELASKMRKASLKE